MINPDLTPRDTNTKLQTGGQIRWRHGSQTFWPCLSDVLAMPLGHSRYASRTFSLCLSNILAVPGLIFSQRTSSHIRNNERTTPLYGHFIAYVSRMRFMLLAYTQHQATASVTSSSQSTSCACFANISSLITLKTSYIPDFPIHLLSAHRSLLSFSPKSQTLSLPQFGDACPPVPCTLGHYNNKRTIWICVVYTCKL